MDKWTFSVDENIVKSKINKNRLTSLGFLITTLCIIM